MLSPPSSTSALTPKRRLSVDSEAESLEEVQEISTPSVSPSDSTVSKETEIFFQGQVQKGKTGRKKKTPHPSAIISAIRLKEKQMTPIRSRKRE